jgi:cephalosporin hydroxylase
MTLAEIFAKYPDTDKDTIHSYAEFYGGLFAPIRDKVRSLWEVGVRGGGSLKAWREYLGCQVVGFDNGSEAGVWESDDPHIQVEFADSCDPSTWSSATWLAERSHGQPDIIIDDGCHHPYAQVATFSILYPHLNSGGVYVIEDVEDITYAEKIAEMFGGTVEDRRKVKNRHDDILVWWKKP